MPSKKKSKPVDLVQQEEDYVAFLKRRLDSDNYKNSATKEEYDTTKRKYDKAKLKLKFLKEKTTYDFKN